jgi:hypothetical protein
VFTKDSKFAFYAEIYEPELMGAEVSKELMMGVQMRVFDAAGKMTFDSKAFRIPVPEKPGNPMVPFAGLIPVKDLAPGQYKLEFIAVDSKQNKAQRTANFEIK